MSAEMLLLAAAAALEQEEWNLAALHAFQAHPFATSGPSLTHPTLPHTPRYPTHSTHPTLQQ